MARIYANENFPLPAVEELRRLEHDVLTVSETGKAGQSWPDGEVLQFATAENRILLTMNRRHFRKLHEVSSAHAGIILCTVDPDNEGLATRIHQAIESCRDCKSQALRVNRPQIKPR